ncbi:MULTISPECIES: phosphatase PAP2 family protein [Methylobacterium]|uniref:phosphatase PAP2 family protein n=1 Tax=Methylobacterium TaxID=407 RepID=UPI001043356F|nr:MULTISPECIES: phosphatase PAP2 family protein [Methylobacterium]MDR7039147.1 membrane-associated phospholipid phosphatase [Methylobacterium sp. BE186]
MMRKEPGCDAPIDHPFPLEEADIALALRLAQAKDTDFVRGLGTVSEIGSQQALLALVGLLFAYGQFGRDPAATRTAGRLLGAHLAASLIKSTVKRLVHRTRPNVLIEDGIYARGWSGPNEGPWQSFPSGHVAVSVAMARALARAHPSWRGRAYAGAGFVLALQVLRGAHYPADVAAGALVGLLAEAASERGLCAAENRRRSAARGRSDRAGR